MTAALSPVTAPVPVPPPRPDMHRAHACLLLALTGLVATHWTTAAAMANLWWHSPTFAHGLLVSPVCVWLVWRQRAGLAACPRHPSPLMLLPLAMLGALWFLATVANVPVLQQYCLVLMVVATVVLVQGRRYARAIAFPLAYLLLAVPFGEVFIPPLIEFTAAFTVGALQLVGIPVFQDNNVLSLPSGSWSVVEACSGLRYLIASVALGTLYAHLSYRSRLRQAAFVAVALVLPIVANGLRAFLIVLVGHCSNMTLAVGIDHLIYGWLFFGLVSALMFWVGARWRDDVTPPPQTAVHPPVQLQVARPAALIGATLAGMAVAAVWPPLAYFTLRAPPMAQQQAQLSLAPPPAPWQAGELSAGDWLIPHAGEPQRWSANYSDGVHQVALQLTWYRHQSKDREILTPVWKTPPSASPHWKELADSTRQIDLARRRVTVRQTIVQAGDVKLLVWRWYRAAGRDTASPLLVKLLLARSKLLGADDDGAEIALVARYDEQPAQAAIPMQRLLSDMLPAIDQGLAHVARH
ncbi:exosortase A [Duganella sp. HH101]|uniref:exosortase A n=1 Tax=Duganella sp. HH101 TaxID=1781066 RepID=UPI0008938A71|nr:exosortase A [Duganella sp. HH101]OFA07074.1 transmembrane exosortase (exosortase_EpsH) [Duganella sp. HH101]